MQTELFGRVTIQTNAQGGQLSAQLSVENVKEGSAIAAHLPAVEQKISEQHGLNASIRLVASFDGGGTGSTGRDQSGSDGRGDDRYPRDFGNRLGRMESGSLNEASEESP